MKMRRFWMRALALLIFTVISAFVSMDAKTASMIQASLPEQNEPWSVQQRILVLTIPLSLSLGLSLLNRRRAQKVRVKKFEEDA